MNSLLTIKGAAKYLNVSINTLCKWDKSGKLIPLTAERRKIKKENNTTI